MKKAKGMSRQERAQKQLDYSPEAALEEMDGAISRRMLRRENIIIVDGGPRSNMNTASLCKAFEKGVHEVAPELNVQHVRLYDLPPYKGCTACYQCKLRGETTSVCPLRDGLYDTLHSLAEADGFVLASPIFYGQWTAMTHAFVERLLFPWERHGQEGAYIPSKKMPVAFINTMKSKSGSFNVGNLSEGIIEACLDVDGSADFVNARYTVHLRLYSRYELDGLDPAKRRAWRKKNWPDYLKEANFAGRHMAKRILKAREWRRGTEMMDEKGSTSDGV